MLVVGGPSRTKRNLTGMGTSRTDSSSTASRSRTNAMVGCSRKSKLPGRWAGQNSQKTDSTSQSTREFKLIRYFKVTRVCFSRLTHKDNSGLGIFRDLLQQLQLMFGFGPMHAGQQHRLLLQSESTTRSTIRITEDTGAFFFFFFLQAKRLACTSFFSMSTVFSELPAVWTLLTSGSVTDSSG